MARSNPTTEGDRTHGLPGLRRSLFLAVAAFVAVSSFRLAVCASPEPGPVHFSRDVLPILSDRCFHCHGPDSSHRKAKLRLDLEEGAKENRGGYSIVSPGDPQNSELWRRVVAEDSEDLMPPTDSHRKPLDAKERDILRRWIEEGAEWGRHWAFEKPERPALPDAGVHPVDAFVRERLKQEGLAPAPPAPAHTQLRRLSFALTGLPPGAAGNGAELLANEGSGIQSAVSAPLFTESDWATLVDRHLDSPHHGERLAMWWLDAARYSDTDGFQQDAERTNWAWRDWVVEAFNGNMPFDRFTIEQFAGDLLPEATPEQILATCFHRNHMTNGEGGRDPEESRIDYVLDRTNTTGTLWLGLTLGCTQCHDHKFDPVSQADYFGLTAFFNSIDEDGKAGRNAKPYLPYRSPLAGRAVEEMEAHVASWEPREAEARNVAEKAFENWLREFLPSLDDGYRAWHPVTPVSATSAEGTEFVFEDGGAVQTTGPAPRQDDYHVAFALPTALSRLTGWKIEVLPHPSHTEGKLSRGENGEFILTNVKLLVRRKGRSQVRDIAMRGAVADYEREAKGRNYGLVKDTLDDDPRNGWTTETGDPTTPHAAVFELEEPLTLAEDEELVLALLHRSTEGNANIGRFRISLSGEAGETVRGLDPSPLEEISRTRADSPDTLDPALRKRLLAQFLLDHTDYQAVKTQLDEAKRQLAETRKAAGELGVMVLAEREAPRETHILVRGEWDNKGEVVPPGVLSSIHPWPEEKTRTRLDLAKWLVSPDNPLTARVVANHLWQIAFGSGLVRTPEDFGLQGEAPTHPELLDWLAVELVESGWDLRHLLRLIVTSETFRQSSDTTPELRERDPENRLLARAPRHRLPAWMIRDNALAASGLLNPALGGPPVKPWQPEGVWEEIFMGRFTYRPSVGPAQHRRTLYAYWRRSSAPTFLFDSAERRVCEVSESRTNTPLHALTLLNDVTMLEAARVLAGSVTRKQPSEDDALSPLRELALRVLSRELETEEMAVVERERIKALAYYESHPDEAATFATVGQQESPSKDQAPEIAAWMTAASLMLNLDEAMTRE